MKKKLGYRGHVYFESVRPSIILTTLQFSKKKNSLYYDIDINLTNILDYLIQRKANKTFLSDVNVLGYVAPDKPVPVIVETVDCGSSECYDSDKEVIEDALNAINMKHELLIFIENEMINKDGKIDGVKEVEPVYFKINSCRQENSHE